MGRCETPQRHLRVEADTVCGTIWMGAVQTWRREGPARARPGQRGAGQEASEHASGSTDDQALDPQYVPAGQTEAMLTFNKDDGFTEAVVRGFKTQGSGEWQELYPPFLLKPLMRHAKLLALLLSTPRAALCRHFGSRHLLQFGTMRDAR